MDINNRCYNYELITKNMRDMICLHDLNGKYTFLTDSVETLLGYKPEELIGTDPYDLFHPDDRIKIQKESHDRALKGNFDNRIEYRIKKKAGDYVWFETITQPIYDLDKKLVALQTASRDITERVQAKFEIKKNKDLLEMFFSQSIDGFFFMQLEEPVNWKILDDDNKTITIDNTLKTQSFIKFNDALLNQFGFSSDEILNLHPIDFFPGRYQNAFDIWYNLFENGRSKIEVESIKKNGDRIIVEGDYIVMYDEYNHILGHFGVQRDITEKKEYQQQLIINSEKLKNEIQQQVSNYNELSFKQLKLLNAVEQVSESIIITDINGMIEYVNPGCCKMTGYSEVEMLGKNPRILNSKKNPSEKIKNMWLDIVSGKVWKGTLINKKKNGEFYNVEVSITPIKNEHGTITHYIGVQNDVTERINFEKSLKRKNRELYNAKLIAEAANRSKSDFLANMSHELRNPLNAVIGFSEILREQLSAVINEEQLSYIDYISESGENLLRLITDILDFVNYESGNSNFEPIEFNLNKALDSIIFLLKEKINKHSIEMIIENDLSENFRIYADEKKIKQVFFNLLLNAVKFTDDGGTITVKTEIENNNIVVSVIDSGIGIEIEDVKKLFKPFERLNDPYSAKYEGLGMGLAISKKLIDMHGGDLFYKENHPGGSIFSFQIPINKKLLY